MSLACAIQGDPSSKWRGGCAFTCFLVLRADWWTFSGCSDPKANKEQNKDKTPSHGNAFETASHLAQADLEVVMKPKTTLSLFFVNFEIDSYYVALAGLEFVCRPGQPQTQRST